MIKIKTKTTHNPNSKTVKTRTLKKSNNPLDFIGTNQQVRLKAHRTFMSFTTHPNRKNKYVVVKNRSFYTTTDKQGIITPNRFDDRVLSSRVKPNLSGEGIAFLVHVGGCSKNLLLFMIQYLVDPENSSFYFNKHVRMQFQEFCTTVGVSHSNDSVTQSLKDLSSNNIILNEQHGKYMINPLIIHCSNDKARSLCISRYSGLLLKKGKDPVLDFYPRYK